MEATKPTEDPSASVPPLPQLTRALSMPHVYARVSLKFLDIDADITDKLFNSAIKHALQSMYGKIGGAVAFEVLKYDNGCGIIKMHKG
eukprot:jgi/Chrzof1/1601/Cz10g14060.t1